MSASENKVVCEMHEEIMDELRGEPVAVQIKTAFAVLTTVLVNAATRDPEELKRAAHELNDLMNLLQ
jgi:hypothetical protein